MLLMIDNHEASCLSPDPIPMRNWNFRGNPSPVIIVGIVRCKPEKVRVSLRVSNLGYPLMALTKA